MINLLKYDKNKCSCAMATANNLDDAIRGLRANTVEGIKYVKPTFHRSIQRNVRLTTRTVMSNYKFINDSCLLFIKSLSFVKK